MDTRKASEGGVGFEPLRTSKVSGGGDSGG